MAPTIRTLPSTFANAILRAVAAMAAFDQQVTLMASVGQAKPSKDRASAIDVFLDALERQGKSVEQWAIEHRFPRPQVYRVLEGKSRGASGYPRQILAAMGIKRSAHLGLPPVGAGLLERENAPVLRIAARAFIASLEAEGKTVTDWARERGHESVFVHNILRGLYVGRRGQAREIMISMGLPVPSNEQPKWTRGAKA